MRAEAEEDVKNTGVNKEAVAEDVLILLPTGGPVHFTQPPPG